MKPVSASAREPTLYLVPYLDEDFDLKVMDALRERGYEVHCARDEGLVEPRLGRTVNSGSPDF